MSDRTLTFIKPEAVDDGYAGKIISIIESAGFKIIGSKMIRMNLKTAREFYKVHQEKEFFEGLTEYASSGPIFILCLEKDNAVEDLRKLIGATDPEKAAEGTIRKLFGKTIRRNGIHASDSNENAEKEIAFFFSKFELLQSSSHDIH
ncbi:MAG: nucleoside-diphosphate kinase [Acidobacteria bacterium]|nr:nucleoside-diphosphate kinase [Acidobacteriota bacterium]